MRLLFLILPREHITEDAPSETACRLSSRSIHVHFSLSHLALSECAESECSLVRRVSATPRGILLRSRERIFGPLDTSRIGSERLLMGKDFLNSYGQGEPRLNAEDLLEVELLESQKLTGGKLTTSYAIIKVLNYKPGAKKRRLPM